MTMWVCGCTWMYGRSEFAPVLQEPDDTSDDIWILCSRQQYMWGYFKKHLSVSDGCKAGISIPLHMECHDTQKLTLHHVQIYGSATESNASLVKFIMMYGTVTYIKLYGTLKNQIWKCELIRLLISMPFICACVCVCVCVCAHAYAYLSWHLSLSVLNKCNSVVLRFFQRSWVS
jgi:hypothetical protein